MPPPYNNEFFFKSILHFKDKYDHPLSDVTKNLYRDNLKWLLKSITHYHQQYTSQSIDILWLLTHPDIVYNIIQKQKNFKTDKMFAPLTIMSFFITFMSLFSHIQEIKDKYPKQHEKYKKYFSIIQNQVTLIKSKGTFSPQQEKGYVTWEDIIKKRQEIASYKYASKEHLILALYTYIPPLRQDFGFIKILHEIPTQHDIGNYIVLSKNNNILVLNDYKTTKYFPQYRKHLPKPLIDIINKSIQIQPRLYLFVISEGLPFKNKKRFGENINRTLLQIFGVPLTPSIIRHSETVYERTLNLSPAQEEQLANEMRHSLLTHNRYRLSESYLQNNNPRKLEDPSGDIFSML